MSTDPEDITIGQVAYMLVYLAKARADLRKQLAITEGFAAFFALTVGAERATDGETFWAWCWSAAAVLLAINCALDIRAYRRERLLGPTDV